MDPRLRGDDASVANRHDATRLALGRMRNSTSLMVVIPAEAGIHCFSVNMDPRLRGDDASVTNRGDVISVTNRCDVTSVTNRRDVTASSVFSPPWRRPLQRIS